MVADSEFGPAPMGLQSQILRAQEGWRVGDQAWIHLGSSPDNPRERGTIVHVFQLEGWLSGLKHYVVQIETSIDPLLMVRDAMCMWRSAEPT